MSFLSGFIAGERDSGEKLCITTSDGDSVEVTWAEVADLIVFVREMKRADERWSTCPKCGGAAMNTIHGNPPMRRCRKCRNEWAP